MRGREDYIRIYVQFFAEPIRRLVKSKIVIRQPHAHLCQCFTIASVLSTNVPSMSSSAPAKRQVSVGAVKALFPSSTGMLQGVCVLLLY